MDRDSAWARVFADDAAYVYVRRDGENNLIVADSLAATLNRERADGLAYVAFRPAREREVARSAPGPLEILLREGKRVRAYKIADAAEAMGVNSPEELGRAEAALARRT